jgi:monoamine oxidase
MAESHVVSGLVAKHSELAGIIQFHRAEIERVAADLKHLDATIKLFAPETDLRSLGAKRVTSSSASVGGFKHFKSKESHTLVLDHSRWPPHHRTGSPALGNKSAKTCHPCYPGSQ